MHERRSVCHTEFSTPAEKHSQLPEVQLSEPGRIAEWRWFVAFCHLELLAELRLCPKLKSVHVDLPVGLNMKVNLAAQTLSFSTAATIRCYVQLGKMDSRALDTADFMEKMNKCFDLVNSSTAFAKHPDKSAVKRCNLEKRLALLNEYASWISQWKVLRQNDGVETTQ